MIVNTLMIVGGIGAVSIALVAICLVWMGGRGDKK